MLFFDVVTQPHASSNSALLLHAAKQGKIRNIDIAAAYVTVGGVREVISSLKAGLGTEWAAVQKRWIVAFDYCRSEPLAIEILGTIPNSSVRIHDGTQILRRRCIPSIPFHPKTFIFRSPSRRLVFAGSGNLSRSGMLTGHEVGLLLEYRAPGSPQDAEAKRKITQVENWYNTVWSAANDAPGLMQAYREIYESNENLQSPAPTDDDAFDPVNSRGALSPKDLRKLRACRHFWIEAGNVTKNLGKGRPGNQLMMKRMSRVYFGVPAKDVAQNSSLTKIQIEYDGFSKADCSLTFSDNGMDKLTLPIPGAGGPISYDNKILIFSRIGPAAFTLTLANGSEIKKYLNKSLEISAAHTMPGGRRWGVY